MNLLRLTFVFITYHPSSLNFIIFQKMSLAFIRFHQITRLPRFHQICKDLIRVRQVLLQFTGFHRFRYISLDCIRFNKARGPDTYFTAFRAFTASQMALRSRKHQLQNLFTSALGFVRTHERNEAGGLTGVVSVDITPNI